MAIPSRQIGWGTEENLLWQISKQLEYLTGVTYKSLSELAPTYKVYTALLTQSGGDDPQSIGSGAVTEGVTYMVDGTGSDADFSNVGGPKYDGVTSINGTYFVAINNDIPNNYSEGQLNYNTGAPVVTVLENTIGNIWFEYFTDGNYAAISNGLFTLNKSICIAMPNQYVESPESLYNFQAFITTTNTFSLNTFFNYAPQDGILNGFAQTSIEIRVYN